METSKLKDILEQHRLWIESNGVQGKRAFLTGANLTGADLTGANLHRAFLTGAFLTGADLRGSSLTGADLTGAYLKDADLTGAYLHRANLTGANLTGANLTGETCLTDANLEGANLTGASLTGASLEGANLSGAILPDISWIIPGCLAKLNQISCPFYLEKDKKYDNFIQDSLGFFIQDNREEKTFDMLVEDRIIRDIPDWLKYTGLKQVLL